jgi:dihydrofolate synthase/folylpolyglutamate synthase
MTYPQAIAYLDSLIDYERRPLPEQARAWNLDRTRALLAAVGNPHQSLRVIHIAGTKGKGSTCIFIASILRAAGCHVGLYTSPHLVDFRERIRLDGICIPKRDVSTLVAQLVPHVEHLTKALPFPPSFFEVYTALALRWFANKKVDFAVLETGLGGRLDATNVVTPLVSVITTIGLDHTVELGPTISHIAREKAGIIKPGIHVICAPQRRDAFREIVRVSRERGAPLYCLAPLAPVAAGFSLRDWHTVAQVSNLCPSHPSCSNVGQSASPPAGGRIASCPISAPTQQFYFTGLDGRTRSFRIPLLGSPQIINASLACAGAQLLGIRAAAIRQGLAAARWPGRFHMIPDDPTCGERSRTTIVLDCAHDGISAIALARDIRATFPGRDVILVLGISRDKDAGAVVGPLCRIAKHVIATAANLPRALDPADLARLIQPIRPVEPIAPVSRALHRAISLAPVSSPLTGEPVGRGLRPPPSSQRSRRLQPARNCAVILVTGSVYVVGEAMGALHINPCDLAL